MKTIILSIGGMSCSACSNGIEKYLNKQNGIFDAKVNLVMANATITYDEKILDIPKIEKYIEKSGYKSLGLFKNFNVEKKKKNEKLLFIIFSILAIILMYISMGHMINLPLPNILEPHKSSKIYSTTLLILTIPFEHALQLIPPIDNIIVFIIIPLIYHNLGLLMFLLSYLYLNL